jgi:hypothetical protein
MKYYTRFISLIFFIILFILPAYNQYRERKQKIRSGDIGVGAGIDYGGYGMQINQFLGPVCIMGGYGYNQVYFMPFGGIKYYMPLEEYDLNFAPYVKVIYGYNSVIIIKNGPSEFYWGLTPGIGTEVRFGKTKSYGFNIDINIPVRTKRFKRDLDYYKLIYSDYKKDFLPVALSLGLQVSLD